MDTSVKLLQHRCSGFNMKYYIVNYNNVHMKWVLAQYEHMRHMLGVSQVSENR